MALKLDRGIRRVTVLKQGDDGPTREVYRQHDKDDERHPIKRLTIVKRDERGRIISRDSYEGERRRKRSSRGLRPVERGVREILEFQVKVLDNYLGRHKRSNEKRRDGWLSDMPRNLFRAVKKSEPKKVLRRIYRSDRNRD
ncbi:MAG: hypothetical protein AB7F35_18940 [Acetobacteraceae bacterium]